MHDAKSISLPPGLPSHLGTGKDGYDELCVLLDITTRDRKLAITNARQVKRILKQTGKAPARRARTAERIRQSLLALYSDPHIRREIWCSLLQHDSISDEIDTHFPSLEHTALARYDIELLTSHPDPERIADLKDFCDMELISEDWRAPAIAAIPRLVEDFTDWTSKSPDNRQEIIAAAFAAATLLDDARLLLWAAGLQDDIALEYSFLNDVSTMSVNDDSPGSPADPNRDALVMLHERSRALRDAANNLADGTPTASQFEALTQLYSAVIELQEPVLVRADANAIADLVSDFSTQLNDIAIASTWLTEEIESLLVAWREAYLEDTELSPAQVRADIDRAVSALPDHLAVVTTSQATEDSAKEALDRHELGIEAKAAASRVDRQRQAALSKKLETARKAVMDAMDEVVDVLMPRPGGNFEMSSPMEVDSPASKEEFHAAAPFPSERAPGPEDGLPTDPSSAEDHSTEAIDVPTAKQQEKKQASEAEPDRPDASPGTKQPPNATESTAERSLRDEAKAGNLERKPSSVNDTVSLSPTQAALWHAVSIGRPGLAYHIARLDRATGAQTILPPPELLAAVALGTVLRGPDDELAAAYGQRVGALLALDFGDAEQPLRDALNLLLLAATLRPAMFASQHGASIPLLRRVELSGPLMPVYRLARAVADQDDNIKRIQLDIPTLTAVIDEGVWKDRIDAHAQEVMNWKESAAAATFKYHGASAIWKHWLRQSGILGKLGNMLLTARPVNAQRVQEIVDVLDDSKSVHALIVDTYRNSVTQRGQIAGSALHQLERHLEKPRELARAWLRIMDARPGGEAFVETVIADLRTAVDSYGPAAIKAIESLRQSRPAPTLDGALVCAARTIESLRSLFRRGDGSRPDILLGANEALADDLLLVTRLRIDSQGAIDDSLAPDDALAHLTDTENHADTLSTAFDIRLAHGDLVGANAIRKRMEVEKDDAAESSIARLDRALAENRAAVPNRLYDLARRLEQAFVYGEVTETRRAEVIARIDAVTDRLETHDGALTASSAADKIAAAVDRPYERAVARVRAQLDEHLPRPDTREQALVEDALQTGDLAILQEQLDCLKRNQPLLSVGADTRSKLRDFLAAAERIEAKFQDSSGPSQSALVQSVRKRQDILGLPFSKLSPSRAKRSAALLELWFQIARKPPADPELVARLFDALGFALAPGAVEAQGPTAAVLRTEPLSARELCPAYAFGSDAVGRYALVFNWNVSARERIIQAISTAVPDSRTIVLHFGRLSCRDRDWLRRWSIEHPTEFVTVDETLVLYLASLPEGQLRPLFECTLAFTRTEPFFTAPGLVPAEAFFGRERERSVIMDRYGSCFVYGGRQLGKTALLHATQVEFHEPNARRLAKYVDLKYENIGIAHDADHLWHVLWREFVKLDVIAPGTAMPRGRGLRLVESIRTSVSDWLDVHKDARILLLLDEADAFLSSDLKEDFPVSTQLKGLMDQTERRFKVVLCGLHNVLRNVERANHPLAHFGEPVCVGPLLANGDIAQARALIREPLEAVGYEFETDNLITKILIRTNYYPSLIQLYGEALLRHLRQTPRRGVPCVITTEDIDATFSRDQFREFIRNRFSLTLQLDERYQVIAYAMAFDLQEDTDGLVDGLSTNRIFLLAREYWAAGFNIPKREFTTLLQEMEGLGILRQCSDGTGPRRYVFRNPNVLRLLGDASTIIDVLLRERELPDVFEASSFHSQYGGTKAGARRYAPLTYEQETQLGRGGRVAVLCGTRGANLADVATFLGDRMVEGRLRLLKLSNDVNELVGAINRLRPDRDTYICLADESEPWSLNWVQRVVDALRKTKRGRKLRVVFRADPEQLWRVVSDLPDEYLGADNDLFDWVATQPWNAAFIRRWCSDEGVHDVEGKIPELLKLTGGWPLLLSRFAESEEKTWNRRVEELNQYIEKHQSDLLDAVGLGTPTARCELEPLRVWSSLNVNEVDTYADLWADEENQPPISPSLLRRRLLWATQLGIVQDVDGYTVFNPLVSRILNTRLTSPQD